MKRGRTDTSQNTDQPEKYCVQEWTGVAWTQTTLHGLAMTRGHTDTGQTTDQPEKYCVQE